MVTVETALLAFIAALEKSRPVEESGLLKLTVWLFALSIVFAAWVLSDIPSVARRLPQGLSFDAYKIYDYPWSPGWVTLNLVAIVQHLFFFAGIIAFAWLINKAR